MEFSNVKAITIDGSKDVSKIEKDDIILWQKMVHYKFISYNTTILEGDIPAGTTPEVPDDPSPLKKSSNYYTFKYWTKDGVDSKVTDFRIYKDTEFKVCWNKHSEDSSLEFKGSETQSYYTTNLGVGDSIESQTEHTCEHSTKIIEYDYGIYGRSTENGYNSACDITLVHKDSSGKETKRNIEQFTVRQDENPKWYTGKNRYIVLTSSFPEGNFIVRIKNAGQTGSMLVLHADPNQPTTQGYLSRYVTVRFYYSDGTLIK